MKSFSTLIQYLVPQHALSGLAGWLATRRWTWFKNWQINFFIRRYHVDLTDALSQNPNDYPDFNNFFNRKLKPGARPVAQDSDAIACPVDGYISQIGDIHVDSLFQAKGFQFTLSSLLCSTQLAQEFIDGSFATIYLSPKDYHRVHMPFKGTLRETIFIPGKLFSVNESTTKEVPQLFARNERLVCIFDTSIGPMAVIFVGAMLVGSINTVWETRSYLHKEIHRERYLDKKISLEKGAELGHFNMGSTVIVLFPKGKIHWLTSFTENSLTRMGQLLAKISPS